MPQMENPAAGKRQGSEIVIRFAPSDILESTSPAYCVQAFDPAAWIARRACLSLATARVVVELAGIGGAR